MKKAPQKHSFLSAFTLLELVFVIVVIGILTTFLLSETKRDITYEAATQLISDIRYTQHLAMIDDTFSNADDSWYKKRWTIVFNKAEYTNNKYAYTIFSDSQAGSAGNPDLDEIAKNPQNSNIYMSGGATGYEILNITKNKFQGMKEMNLGEKYHISKIILSEECSFSSSKRISFDYLGRPLRGNLSSYAEAYENNRMIVEKCKITLEGKDNNDVTIVIEPETGYTYIE